MAKYAVLISRLSDADGNRKRQGECCALTEDQAEKYLAKGYVELCESDTPKPAQDEEAKPAPKKRGRPPKAKPATEDKLDEQIDELLDDN